MTRRKSLCVKWTLVVLVSVFFSSVCTRPQDSSPSEVVSPTISVSTEPTLRYRFRDELHSINNLPINISFNNNKSENGTKVESVSFNVLKINNSELYNIDTIGRISRLLRKKYKINQKLKPKTTSKPNIKSKVPTVSGSLPYPSHDDLLYENNKTTIRKVLTKWTDKSKYEDSLFSHNIKTSTKKDTLIFSDFKNDETDNEDEKAKIKYTKIQHNQFYAPPPQYSDETHVYTNNVHLIGYPLQKPQYSYTVRPNPTPVVTNVGYPEPWPQNPQFHRKTTTRKPAPVTEPLKDYNYHNVINNYPNLEVTTFQPTSAYTERIVIRPEEYSATPGECPTIYLTLNNTFQGQGKEACPDLNIAVNTNVINKNVVIESEEDDTDSLLPGGFGLPLGDDSANDESGNDYFQSDESQGQVNSASIEGTELANYNAVNTVHSSSAEVGGLASPSSHSPVISKPSRPNNEDNDLFGFSSLVDFFRPAINLLGWLGSINPLVFGLIPLLLTPIAFLFAGSGLAALFSPWFLPYGREASEIIHVYKPSLHLEDRLKNWHIHSFPETRRERLEPKRTSKELVNQNPVQRTLFNKLQDWMKATKNKLKDIDRDLLSNHKSKRKKREIWLRQDK